MSSDYSNLNNNTKPNLIYVVGYSIPFFLLWTAIIASQQKKNYARWPHTAGNEFNILLVGNLEIEDQQNRTLHFCFLFTTFLRRPRGLWLVYAIYGTRDSDPQFISPSINVYYMYRAYIPVYVRQILSLFLLKVRDHVDLCGDGTFTCPAKLYPPPFRCDSIKDTFCQHIYLCYNIYKYVNPHPTRRSFHRIPRSMHLIWCFDDGGWLVAGGRTLPKGQAKCMYI